MGRTAEQRTPLSCACAGSNVLDRRTYLSTFEHMATTTLVRARVKTERVKKVSRILDRMGLKPADVVNMVFARIEQQRALPFAVIDAGSDYAFEEYGVTPAELVRFERRLDREIARERKAGTIRPVRSADDLR